VRASNQKAKEFMGERQRKRNEEMKGKRGEGRQE